MKRTKLKKSMQRTKPKQRLVNTAILKRIKRKACAYYPYIRPIIDTLPVETILYHLSDIDYQKYKDKVYEA